MLDMNKINIDIIKKIKKNIYSKPHKKYYHQLYNNNKNYNNNMLTELLDDNKKDNAKNVMISELDIKINNSPDQSLEDKKPPKKISLIKNVEQKNEFKKELTDNIMKFLQKNKENNNNLNEAKRCNEKNDIIERSKKALNLTSITPNNVCFKTINVNKKNDLKINAGNYFIKIKRNLNPNKKKVNGDRNNVKNEYLIKNIKNKNMKSFIGINNNKNKKFKKTNIIFNHQRDSLFLTGKKKSKNFQTYNENSRINSSNIKFNKNNSFFKDSINKSNTLRNSFKTSVVKNTFKNLNKHKIGLSNSKPKETIKCKTKNLFIKTKSKYTLTENNYICNTTKNISNKRYDTNNFSHFSNNIIKNKLIPNKYKNLKLKDLNFISNNIIYPRNNFSSLFKTFNTDKDRNNSTIFYEKKKLKSPLSKNMKIQVKKNFKVLLNKNPINILNININKNNNFIMNINNENSFNNNNYKVANSYSKTEGKIRKFFSFQNFLNLNDHYKKIILKKNGKERKMNIII